MSLQGRVRNRKGWDESNDSLGRDSMRTVTEAHAMEIAGGTQHPSSRDPLADTGTSREGQGQKICECRGLQWPRRKLEKCLKGTLVEGSQTTRSSDLTSVRIWECRKGNRLPPSHPLCSHHFTAPKKADLGGWKCGRGIHYSLEIFFQSPKSLNLLGVISHLCCKRRNEKRSPGRYTVPWEE